MKTFLSVTVLGIIVFNLVAIIEERDLFFGAWLGYAPANEARMEWNGDDSAAAEKSLREYLALLPHLYGTAGDIRFADRLPATDEVLGEIYADIRYLRSNHRRQDMRLVQLQILGKEPMGLGLIQILTKEYWVITTHISKQPQLQSPAHSNIVDSKYLLRREGSRWKVLAWDLLTTAPQAGM